METLKDLERKGLDVSRVESDIPSLLKMHTNGMIARNAMPKILWELSTSELSLTSVIDDIGLKKLDQGELENAVNDIIKDNDDLFSDFKTGRIGPLMGAIMDSIGDRVEGADVHEFVLSRK